MWVSQLCAAVEQCLKLLRHCLATLLLPHQMFQKVGRLCCHLPHIAAHNVGLGACQHACLPTKLQGKLPEALEALLVLEKQQRLAEDMTGTKMACTSILRLLREANDWKGLNEHILLLAKRRSQLRQVGGSALQCAPGRRVQC